MNLIKKIFDNKTDEGVHLQFQKFSKGEFRNRALIEVKKTGKNWTIKTSAEFANGLVGLMAEELGENSTKITGVIISTLNLKENPEFNILLAHANVKQFQGVKRYLISEEMTGKELLNFLEKNPKAFFALTFNVGDEKLKIKPKAPKSGKSGSKGEERPKADFCSLKTGKEKIAQGFIFERADFKKAEIAHTFIIDEIKIPEELKNSDDFTRIREESKRKGRVVREAFIDGEKIKSEREFEA